MTSSTSFQPLLACNVSFEKSADSLMGSPFYHYSLQFQSNSILLHARGAQGTLQFSWMGIILVLIKVHYWLPGSLAPGFSAFQPLLFPLYSHLLGVLIHLHGFKYYPCADHFQMSISSPKISLNFQTLIFICLFDISIFISNRHVNLYTKMNS